MDLVKIFNKLRKQYGPQGWWPICHSRHAPCPLPAGTCLPVGMGQVPAGRCRQAGGHENPAKNNHDHLFEICIGAILTQNTAWTNVEKAIKCLLKANLVSPKAIAACPTKKLQKCIRSSGYYKQKTKKLKIFSAWLIKNYQGDLREFFKKPLAPAREELLSLWGIGPETADSILLYAGKKPIFVIDTYTKRLCRQHGVEFKTYDKYQKFFEDSLRSFMSSPRRRGSRIIKTDSRFRGSDNLAKLYNEYHALIVKCGKNRNN